MLEVVCGNEDEGRAVVDGDDAAMAEIVRQWVYGVGVFCRGDQRVCDGGCGRREESCCVAVEKK